MENGSEYRTLLKAFGIRFDVLVYGNVSPGDPAYEGTREVSHAHTWALKRPSGAGVFPWPTGHLPHQLLILYRVELSDYL